MVTTKLNKGNTQTHHDFTRNRQEGKKKLCLMFQSKRICVRPGVNVISLLSRKVCLGSRVKREEILTLGLAPS